MTHSKDNRSLALVGVGARVRSAMQSTRVEQFFKFYDTVEAAQAASS